MAMAGFINCEPNCNQVTNFTLYVELKKKKKKKTQSDLMESLLKFINVL